MLLEITQDRGELKNFGKQLFCSKLLMGGKEVETKLSSVYVRVQLVCGTGFPKSTLHYNFDVSFQQKLGLRWV